MDRHRKGGTEAPPSKQEKKLLDQLDEIQIDRSVSDIWPYTFAAPKADNQFMSTAGGLNDSQKEKDKDKKKPVAKFFELPFLDIYKPFEDQLERPFETPKPLEEEESKNGYFPPVKNEADLPVQDLSQLVGQSYMGVINQTLIQSNRETVNLDN